MVRAEQEDSDDPEVVARRQRRQALKRLERRGAQNLVGTYKEPQECEITIRGLMPGIMYMFRVAAVNKLGRGEYSQASISMFTKSKGKGWLLSCVFACLLCKHACCEMSSLSYCVDARWYVAAVVRLVRCSP